MKKIAILLFIFITTIQITQAQSTAKEQLHELIERDKQFREKLDPTKIPDDAWTKEDHAIAEISVAAQQKRADFWRTILKDLAKVDQSKLDKANLINYDMFKFITEDAVAEIENEVAYLIPINSDGGFHINYVYMVGAHKYETVEDYEKYITKLARFKKYADDHIALMRIGMKKGYTLAQVVLHDYETSIDPHIVDKVEDSYFYQPLMRMPASFSTRDQIRLHKEAKKAISESIIPGYQTFSEFIKQEYRPAARKTLGASEFPNGKAYYQQRIKYYTNLDLTADEVFEIGQEEVKRIRKDMEAILEEVDYEGSFADFLAFLRTDKQFYCETGEELLKEASFLAKKIDGKLPQFFGKLPRLTYGVAPVPDAIAPKYTTGRYSPGSAENHKAGHYWVNTYNLPSRPLYVLPALTLHEAVPGHHLQIALAEELGDLPDFRNTYLSSYGEGWALYCEWLGEEMGIYTTPYTRFGRMTYEMWRACRLVVDTGLHAKGWTREQAVDFMASNTALSLHEVGTEIDRYIGWPGQALSYKMGELKIRELRKLAETKLGDKFNIRDFHDVILANGSIPLFVLERLVGEWIDNIE